MRQSFAALVVSISQVKPLRNQSTVRVYYPQDSMHGLAHRVLDGEFINSVHDPIRS